jgi:hypothetical protein
LLGTEIINMPLPYEQEWLWYPWFNILVLAPHLDAEGCQRAVDAMLTEWRSSLRDDVGERLRSMVSR